MTSQCAASTRCPSSRSWVSAACSGAGAGDEGDTTGEVVGWVHGKSSFSVFGQSAAVIVSVSLALPPMMASSPESSSPIITIFGFGIWKPSSWQ